MPTDFISTVKSLANSYDCGQIVILADGGSSWRRSLHPGYKMTRRKRHENATEEEKRDSERFFEYYQQTLDNCEFPILRYQGVEADDIAAYIVENKYALDINEIWMISSDKDWDLLIEEDVSRFSTVTRKETTYDNWDHPVDIEQYIDLKTLMGDKGDDVPGVDGVGPKRAVGLLEEYGSVFDLIGNLPLPGNAKYIQALNESKDQMLLSYQLMDLRSFCEEAIGDKLEMLQDDLAKIYGRVI